MVYWVSSVVQTRQDIEKRFSVSFKGVENEAFLIKIWNLKFSFLSFAKIAIFAKKMKNNVLSFLLMIGLCVINGTQ